SGPGTEFAKRWQQMLALVEQSIVDNRAVLTAAQRAKIDALEAPGSDTLLRQAAGLFLTVTPKLLPATWTPIVNWSPEFYGPTPVRACHGLEFVQLLPSGGPARPLLQTYLNLTASQNATLVDNWNSFFETLNENQARVRGFSLILDAEGASGEPDEA